MIAPRLQRPARALALGACLLFTLSASRCLPAEQDLGLFEAYSEIGAAIDFKARDCGNQPSYPLLIPGTPTEYGVRLCSLLILREPCPFTDYPAGCLEMYTNSCEICDLPGLDP